MNTSYISKSPFELERNGQDNTNLIVLIEKNIIPMIEILFDQNCKTGSTKTTFGVPVKIFGLGRMKLVECFHLLLKLENEEIFKTLQFYKFFPKYLVILKKLILFIFKIRNYSRDSQQITFYIIFFILFWKLLFY